MIVRYLFSCAVSAALVGAALCAPPTLDLPDTTTATGQYVRFTPKTDAVTITYIGLSGEDSFPSEELKDSKRFLWHTRGIPAGSYKFVAIAASATGEQTRKDFTIIIPGPVVPPVPPTPPTPPVPVPNPNPAPSALTPPLYVLLVEDGVKRTPAQGAVIADAAMWNRLNTSGVRFRLFTRADPAVESLKLGTLADTTGLPAVIVRDSKGVDRAFKLPDTSAQLEATVKGLAP